MATKDSTSLGTRFGRGMVVFQGLLWILTVWYFHYYFNRVRPIIDAFGEEEMPILTRWIIALWREPPLIKVLLTFLIFALLGHLCVRFDRDSGISEKRRRSRLCAVLLLDLAFVVVMFAAFWMPVAQVRRDYGDDSVPQEILSPWSGWKLSEGNPSGGR